MKKQNLLKYIEQNTDLYFTKTKHITEAYPKTKVVYAVFIRKPTIYACTLAINWLKECCLTLEYDIKITENFKDGDKVPAGDPLFFIEGYISEITEFETLILQKIGVACSCAWHAYVMTKELPNVEFISMIARHMPSAEAVQIAEYGISIGSLASKKEGSKGFIGCSNQANSGMFNSPALGTMPHALIGYAGSTLEAAKKYYEILKPKTLTVLVDYYGKEVTDTLEVCNYFSDLAKEGKIAIRIDTHGQRYLEGLNNDKSHDIIEKHVPNAFFSYKNSEEINYLIGKGVSAASIFYMKDILNKNGFSKVKIIGSSGFNINKCSLMGKVKAPLDIIGTGSTLPEKWADTYATADIISYNGKVSVKQGREYLIKKWENIRCK